VSLRLKTYAHTLPLVRAVLCLPEVIRQGLSHFGWVQPSIVSAWKNQGECESNEFGQR